MEEGISACVLFFITSDSFIKRFLSQLELLLISLDFWEIFFFPFFLFWPAVL